MQKKKKKIAFEWVTYNEERHDKREKGWSVRKVHRAATFTRSSNNLG